MKVGIALKPKTPASAVFDYVDQVTLSAHLPPSQLPQPPATAPSCLSFATPTSAPTPASLGPSASLAIACGC